MIQLGNHQATCVCAKKGIPRGTNIIFSRKLTRPVVKGWALEMISTFIWDSNLGAQSCKTATENWQEANNGGHYRKI